MKKYLIILLGCLLSVSAFANWALDSMIGGAWRSHAFQVGRDTNGNPLYLCHGDIQGSTQPGKTWPGYNKCNVPFAGREVLLNSYQVFYGYPRGHWEHTGGHIPYAAMTVGRDVNGNTLYLCRARYGNSVQPGKTWRGYGRCNIPYGGREVIMNQYEVYVLGHHHHWHRPHHHASRECVTGPFGKHVCGYHCVTTGMAVACARKPDESCMANDFGQVQCGYDCHRDDFGQVHCG